MVGYLALVHFFLPFVNGVLAEEDAGVSAEVIVCDGDFAAEVAVVRVAVSAEHVIASAVLFDCHVAPWTWLGRLLDFLD